MEHPSRVRPATLDAPLAPGRALGRYEILERLAAGGMATVYLGRALGVGGFERLVAIKQCHPHLSRDEQFAEMFLQEARLAARIHHPNVVATLDVGHADDLYIVMDYVEGAPLSRLLETAARSGRAMPTAIGLRIVIDVLAGLHATHELRGSDGPLGLVHRDVSPQNIMVGTDGRAQLVDFGLAKATARTAASRDGSLKGKLAYMAPEQFQSGASVTRQVDVWAAGVVAWETLTGERLHAFDSDAETIHSVTSGPCETPSSVANHVPTMLDAPVMRALDRDVARRFATAAAFSEAIERSGAPIASAREVAAYVSEQLAGPIAARRAMIESLTRTHGAVSGLRATEPTPLAQAARLHTPTELLPRPQRSRVRPWAIGALLLALLGGAAVGISIASARFRPSTPQTVTTPDAPIRSPRATATTSPGPATRGTAPTAPSIERPSAVAASPAVPETQPARSPSTRTRRARSASPLYIPRGL